MSKIILAIVITVVLSGTFVVLTRKDKDSASSSNTSNSSSSGNNSSANTSANELDPNNYTAGADIGETLDATGQSSVEIIIDDNIFQTTYLKISKDTKVTWVNKGNVRHDVTSAQSSPKKGLSSELLARNESYDFTFTETGIYEYFCTPHSSEMRGVITVVD